MITIRIITKEHQQDIHIRNEPFSIWGRMIPSYVDRKWGYSVEEFSREQVTEMCFPDEDYDYDRMCRNSVLSGPMTGTNALGSPYFRISFSNTCTFTI